MPEVLCFRKAEACRAAGGHGSLFQASPTKPSWLGRSPQFPASSAVQLCSPARLPSRSVLSHYTSYSKTMRQLLTHQMSQRTQGPSTSFQTAWLLPRGSLSSWLPVLILNVDMEIPTWPHIWHYPFWKARRHFISLQAGRGYPLAIVTKSILSHITCSPFPQPGAAGNMSYFRVPLLCTSFDKDNFITPLSGSQYLISPVPNVVALFWRTSLYLH